MLKGCDVLCDVCGDVINVAEYQDTDGMYVYYPPGERELCIRVGDDDEEDICNPCRRKRLI
jgi:hypothetical protein